MPLASALFSAFGDGLLSLNRAKADSQSSSSLKKPAHGLA
jgi:hypothetical protein